jgi:hypothetical protein
MVYSFGSNIIHKGKIFAL